MFTRNINNIAPTLDETGRLIRLVFEAEIQDENGLAAGTETIDLSGGFSLPAAGSVKADVDGETISTHQLEPYTDAEIKAMCQGIADDRQVFTRLEHTATLSKVPKFNPDSIVVVELTDSQKRSNWMNLIDNNVAIVMGRFTRFSLAYEQREKAALDYKANGYTGDPTEWVTRYADNVGISYTAATDLIISQANSLRGALLQLENLRMDKYKVQNAATIEEAQDEFTTIIKAVATIDGGLI